MRSGNALVDSVERVAVEKSARHGVETLQAQHVLAVHQRAAADVAIARNDDVNHAAGEVGK
jgi:hypothetical protein